MLNGGTTKQFDCLASGGFLLCDPKTDLYRVFGKTADTIFVRSTRVANGRVIAHGPHDDLGLIPADNLSPQKARILLMLALTRFSEPSELLRVFAEY